MEDGSVNNVLAINPAADENMNADINRSTDMISDELTCPVCLHLLYAPTRCMPCKHMFCGPCLKLVKRKHLEDNAEQFGGQPNLYASVFMHTPCPMCRQTVAYYVEDSELEWIIAHRHPGMTRRWGFQSSVPSLPKDPLPSSPPRPSIFEYLVPKNALAAGIVAFLSLIIAAVLVITIVVSVYFALYHLRNILYDAYIRLVRNGDHLLFSIAKKTVRWLMDYL